MTNDDWPKGEELLDLYRKALVDIHGEEKVEKWALHHKKGWYAVDQTPPTYGWMRGSLDWYRRDNIIGRIKTLRARKGEEGQE